MSATKAKSATVTTSAADDPAMSHKQAAAYLGVSPKTLSNWKTLGVAPKTIDMPKIPGQKKAAVRYRRSALNAFIESGSMAAAAQ